MTTYIALVRGINVGGHAKVSMSDLRGMVTRMGFRDPQSLLNSGNLVFRSDVRSASKLETMLEEEAKKRLAIDTLFFVRTSGEMQTIIKMNPFPREAESDPGRFAVIFFKNAPEQKSVKALQGMIAGPEVIRSEGRQAYVLYPDGQGRSKLTLTLIESRLHTKGTGRNWNTVLKLATSSADRDDN